jgi:hypothetical protein
VREHVDSSGSRSQRQRARQLVIDFREVRASVPFLLMAKQDEKRPDNRSRLERGVADLAAMFPPPPVVHVSESPELSHEELVRLQEKLSRLSIPGADEAPSASAREEDDAEDLPMSQAETEMWDGGGGGGGLSRVRGDGVGGGGGGGGPPPPPRGGGGGGGGGGL